MNTEDKNINNAAGGRCAYLPPCAEIIKMETTNPLAESLKIPRRDEDTEEAFSKPWQDDMDMWDEDDSQNND